MLSAAPATPGWIAWPQARLGPSVQSGVRLTAPVRRPLPALLLLLLFHGVPVLAAQPSVASWQEISAPGVKVLFEEPELEPFGQRVASKAVEALDKLSELFGATPPPVTITIDGRTDRYGAIAPPLPRPSVSLPALFPAFPEISLRTPDPLYQLLLHELTHTVQLTYLERPAGVAMLPRVGLLGETVAPLPPGWLLEGLAVWAAETLVEHPGLQAGESTDARARGVLAALASEGEWPSLADVSLLSHREWPGNEARYLLGAGFVAELVERYGWETVLRSLRRMNAGWYLRPFDEAWRKVTGDELAAIWWSWAEEVREEALGRLAREDEVMPALTGRQQKPQPPIARQLTTGGRASTVLSVDPGGRRVAWVPAGGGLVLSALGPQRLTTVDRLLNSTSTPLSLAWLGDEKLVYTRFAPDADTRFVDLFEFDISSGRETRLTWGERARFVAVGPSGCIWYVRDVVSEGSSLKRLCEWSEPEFIFTAPAGTHLVGLAVSPVGRVALSLWDSGRVDLALLEEGRLEWLTQDADQELEPEWTAAGELLFRSDRNGIFEIHSIHPQTLQMRRLTASVGGAFSPSVEGEAVVFARLGGNGYDLAAVHLDQTVESVATERAAWRSGHRSDGSAETTSVYPVRNYRPGISLVPFGWLPEVTVVSTAPLSLSASATVLGQDLSGDHSYSLRLGYDPRATGSTWGGWARLRYDYRALDVFDLFQRPPPFGFGVQFGAWPHTPHLGTTSEVAFGAFAEVRARDYLRGWTGAARLRGGAIRLPSFGDLQFDGRIDLVASRRYSDLWGYGVRGPSLAAHLLWSADHGGGAPAAWLEASTILPPGEIPLTVQLALRAGWRPPLPTATPVSGFAAAATFGVRKSLPVGWRYADGLFALERVSVEGRLQAWHHGATAAAAQLSVWGDTMLRYGAPVSLGGTVGYSDGWWYRLGVRLPL